jgi:7-cyano-7-deazaguanine reductase
MPSRPSKRLETFANPHPDRAYRVHFVCPEYTSLCPKTGQPDFGTVEVEYVPDRLCIELKSFKLYLWSYRNEGVFYEDLTNRMLGDLVKACAPRWMKVTGRFTVRGGIQTTVTAEHGGEKIRNGECGMGNAQRRPAYGG